MEDPTTYVKITAFVNTIFGLLSSLFNDRLYKVVPSLILPAVFVIKGKFNELVLFFVPVNVLVFDVHFLQDQPCFCMG